MATPKPNQEKIDAIIRQNKIDRSIKHTTRTSFKPGQKVPNAGRKKGSKTDVQKKILKHYKKHFELLVATMIVSIQDDDILKLDTLSKLKHLPTLAKFFMPEQKAVETTEKKITKIEVSFSEEFGNPNHDVIDITARQAKQIEDENEDAVNE